MPDAPAVHFRVPVTIESTGDAFKSRSLGIRMNGAEMRRATLEGRDHLVVPVVMLVGNSVVRPMGSTGPEFVPAEELAWAPMQWNGRPVVAGHPEGGTMSANQQSVIETSAFGVVLNARFEDDKLKADAWLDIAKAKRLGGEPQSVVERIEAGQMIEVSVGAIVQVHERGGSYAGERYEFVWGTVLSDHLAMLAADAIGACSNDMGCGAPRAASGPTKEAKTMPQFFRPFLDRLHRLVQGEAEARANATDVEVREALFNLLLADVPAFEGIAEVDYDAKSVVYATMTEDAVRYYRRGFSIGEGGAFSLAGDPQEVEPTFSYEPVGAAPGDTEPEPEAAIAAADDDPAPATSAEPEPIAATSDAPECGCNQGEGRAARSQTEGGGTPMKDTLIGRLIACSRAPFNEGDREQLSSLSEDQLKAMADSFATPEPAPNTVAIDANELADIRAAALAHKAAEAARLAALVGEVTELSSEFSADDLAGQSVAQLTKLAAALRAAKPAAPRSADYSAARVTSTPADAGDDAIPAPKSLAEVISNRRRPSAATN